MTITYLGTTYPIHHHTTFDERLCWFEDGLCKVFHRSADPEVHRKTVETHLEREGKRYLHARVRHWSDQTGLEFRSVRFGKQRSLWGSCNQYGDLRLNLALLEHPEDAIDYVIVHELAHTKELNHSASFWAVVRQHMPEYVQFKRYFSKIYIEH